MFVQGVVLTSKPLSANTRLGLRRVTNAKVFAHPETKNTSPVPDLSTRFA